MLLLGQQKILDLTKGIDCVCSCSGLQVVGERGESTTVSWETAGGAQEEAGGAASEGGEETSCCGGETTAETGGGEGEDTRKNPSRQLFVYIHALYVTCYNFSLYFSSVIIKAHYNSFVSSPHLPMTIFEGLLTVSKLIEKKKNLNFFLNSIFILLRLLIMVENHCITLSSVWKFTETHFLLLKY